MLGWILTIVSVIGAASIMLNVREIMANRNLKGVNEYLINEIMDLEEDIEEIFDYAEEDE